MSQNKLFPLSNTISFVNTIYAQLSNWFSEKAREIRIQTESSTLKYEAIYAKL